MEEAACQQAASSIFNVQNRPAAQKDGGTLENCARRCYNDPDTNLRKKYSPAAGAEIRDPQWRLLPAKSAKNSSEPAHTERSKQKHYQPACRIHSWQEEKEDPSC